MNGCIHTQVLCRSSYQDHLFFLLRFSLLPRVDCRETREESYEAPVPQICPETSNNLHDRDVDEEDAPSGNQPVEDGHPGREESHEGVTKKA